MTTRIQPTQAAPLALVTVKDIPRIDSRILAESLGNKHKAIMSLVDKYQAELKRLGHLTFQMSDGARKQGGGKAERVALLNEDQAFFLLSLSRNTARVVELKGRMVQAFSAARRNAQQRQTEYLPEYHALHDRIKALAGDSDHARFVHMNANRLANKVAGIEAGQRHTIPVAMLTAVNHVAALAMAGAADHHQGYARAKAALGTPQDLLAPPDKGPAACLHLASGRADHGL